MFKKVAIAILLLLVLIAGIVAIIFVTQLSPSNGATVGVHVGDSFSYSIVGISTLIGLDAVETPEFSRYNQTDYFKITITEVNGTSVSFDILWRFINGTEITNKETIDLSNGNKSHQDAFWAIYPSNLNVGALIRPTGYDGLTVNLTDTRTYADSTRESNFWHLDTEFTLGTDPTGSTFRYEYIGVYFDKQTGMLETLTNYTEYNNPAKSEIVTWNLVNSTVWAVQ